MTSFPVREVKTALVAHGMIQQQIHKIKPLATPKQTLMKSKVLDEQAIGILEHLSN